MQTLREMIDAIQAEYPPQQVRSQTDGCWLDAPKIDMLTLASQMAANEVHLSTITAAACPDGETDLIYHYRQGSSALNVKTRTQGSCAPSIAPICLAASWIEREIQDLYAVTFIGHPNPARLIRPPELAAGFFREPGGKDARQEPWKDAEKN